MTQAVGDDFEVKYGQLEWVKEEAFEVVWMGR